MADHRNGKGPARHFGRPGDKLAAAAGAAPARSALSLRFVLALFGLLVCGGAAVLFLLLDVPRPLVGTAVVFAVTAAVDLAVILRRKHRGEPG
jgi:hypothetical protein